jgi:hypothetical protein
VEEPEAGAGEVDMVGWKVSRVYEGRTRAAAVVAVLKAGSKRFKVQYSIFVSSTQPSARERLLELRAHLVNNIVL